MISSYFFIPGDHPKLLEKLETIHSDILIIDLEDSINQNNLDAIFNKIANIAIKQNLFVRPRLFDGFNLVESTVSTLLKNGFHNFIIPKFRNIYDLIKLENIIFKQCNIKINVILLIENPESLFSLQDILVRTRLNVVGIGFGSQDYCNETGMAHEAELLKIPRFMISGIAKAFRKSAIDIACMNIKNKEVFINELEDAKVMGFDAKFIIHPTQLDLLKNYKIYSDMDTDEAEHILAEFDRLNEPTVFIYKGRAVEPPHIRNYQKILNWKNRYGIK